MNIAYAHMVQLNEYIILQMLRPFTVVVYEIYIVVYSDYSDEYQNKNCNEKQDTAPMRMKNALFNFYTHYPLIQDTDVPATIKYLKSILPFLLFYLELGYHIQESHMVVVCFLQIGFGHVAQITYINNNSSLFSRLSNTSPSLSSSSGSKSSNISSSASSSQADMLLSIIFLTNYSCPSQLNKLEIKNEYALYISIIVSLLRFRSPRIIKTLCREFKTYTTRTADICVQMF
ncbi:hypothetical protein AGLY_009285 [Aphis glycines]|uniref:Uncharacterized protein n=1 Tax=Aphis glycines TaxID=307491 RepID=A0A6G0TIC2_APHGL|nr:hypothetical protein AGLY_009285 [Aphis glycines]